MAIKELEKIGISVYYLYRNDGTIIESSFCTSQTTIIKIKKSLEECGITGLKTGHKHGVKTIEVYKM